MDPRSRALADLINDVSTLEERLDGFEQQLASCDEPEEQQALQQTVSELRQELSHKRTRLQELSDGSTGCDRRNINPFDREWIEESKD